MNSDTNWLSMADLVLRELYRAHDELTRERETACAPGCAACCRDRVQLTTLEAAHLVEHLRLVGREDLLERLAGAASPEVYRPAWSMNALARMCLAQEEPPAESDPPPARPCPLLADGLCQAYEARPLACRTMASRRRCPPDGQAEQDPWWVTLDTVFFQLVEQADAGGGFGYLGPVLALVLGGEARGLVACENLPGLPVPPQHQARLQATLGPLLARPVAGQSLGMRLQSLRRD
ncbi:MAG: YkgJ family cysteine cluster protein [Desulfarculus sp.]|nr:YkgJ family cysteine cluster protein [Desulfarculus sp.]